LNVYRYSDIATAVHGWFCPLNAQCWHCGTMSALCCAAPGSRRTAALHNTVALRSRPSRRQCYIQDYNIGAVLLAPVPLQSATCLPSYVGARCISYSICIVLEHTLSPIRSLSLASESRRFKLRPAFSTSGVDDNNSTLPGRQSHELGVSAPKLRVHWQFVNSLIPA
jgi:hypothetical protein